MNTGLDRLKVVCFKKCGKRVAISKTPIEKRVSECVFGNSIFHTNDALGGNIDFY